MSKETKNQKLETSQTESKTAVKRPQPQPKIRCTTLAHWAGHTEYVGLLTRPTQNSMHESQRGDGSCSGIVKLSVFQTNYWMAKFVAE